MVRTMDPGKNSVFLVFTVSHDIHRIMDDSGDMRDYSSVHEYCVYYFVRTKYVTSKKTCSESETPKTRNPTFWSPKMMKIVYFVGSYWKMVCFQKWPYFVGSYWKWVLQKWYFRHSKGSPLWYTQNYHLKTVFEWDLQINGVFWTNTLFEWDLQTNDPFSPFSTIKRSDFGPSIFGTPEIDDFGGDNSCNHFENSKKDAIYLLMPVFTWLLENTKTEYFLVFQHLTSESVTPKKRCFSCCTRYSSNNG